MNRNQARENMREGSIEMRPQLAKLGIPDMVKQHKLGRFKPNRDVDRNGRTNGDRAIRAEEALFAYIQDDTPDESHLRDLLCDLMHYCHREGRNFNAELEMARSCFLDEAS